MANYGLIITASNLSAHDEEKRRDSNREIITKLFENNLIYTIPLKNPSLEVFSEKIDFIKSNAQSSSVTYIYINCHGSTEGLHMLLTGNNTYNYSYSRLKASLDVIPGKKVLIIDSCHSGSSITDIEESVIVNSALFNTSTNHGDANSISGVFRNQDYYVLVACSANELSWGNDSGNYFTKAVSLAVGASSKTNGISGALKGVLGIRPASRIDNRYVTLSEICKYTRDHKGEKGHLQVDYCYPEKSDFPIFGDSPISGTATYYIVEIKIADAEGAGTDSNIYIKFVREDQTTSKYLLGHDNIDDFEQNKTYRYIVKVNESDEKPMKDLKAVIIESDNINDYPEMLIEYIKITDTGTNLSYRANCSKNEWIDKQHPTRRFDLRKTGHTYRIYITVGKDDCAGTDADILVQLKGKNGYSSNVLLDTDIDDFERETSNPYMMITDYEIGELESITVITNNAGKYPKFHIVKIAVEDTNDNTVYSSSESVWLDKTNTRHTFALTPKRSTVYLVNIQISNVEDAGTDANIYIQLYGEKGASEQILLETPGKNDFEANTFNTFLITSVNLGELSRAVITNDCSGPDPGMKIDCIEITDKSNGQKYFADCERWLDKEHGKTASIQLSKGSIVCYTVYIMIADVKDAGTDANVFLTLRGDNGDSHSCLLDIPNHDDFEKGSFMTYKIFSGDLGTLRRVSVSHDNTNKDPGMRIAYIQVSDHNNHTYRVNVNEWLDSESGTTKWFSF